MKNSTKFLTLILFFFSFLISADELVDKLKIDYNVTLRQAYKHYNEKNYPEAIKLYREYIESNVGDSGNLYNLSCCYGLNNQPDEAAIYLKIAFEKGFNDLNHIMNDPDFINVRDTEVFKKTVEDLKQLVPEKKFFGETAYYPVEIYCKSRIYKSKGFKADTEPKLVVAFHGWGDNVDNFSKLGQLFDAYNVIFLSIQAPYAFKPGDKIGYSWADGFGGDNPELADITRNTMVNYVDAAIKDVRKRFGCEQTFITGFSQGGWLTYLYGIKHYKTIDAMVPMGGFMDTNLYSNKELRRASKIPVHLIHGNEDKVVDFKEAEKALAILKKAGYNAELYPFDGAHVINRDLMMEIFSKLLN